MTSSAATLAFLNLGPTELILILLLFLLLFGAEQLPGMARSLARFQVKVQSMYRDFAREVETPEQRAFREQVAFEQLREAQVKQADPAYQEELALRRAAQELDIPTEGRPLDAVRRDLAARANPEGAGGAGDTERAV